MNQTTDIPILGIVARSGTGKTTLIEKLIPLLSKKQLKIAVIKHSHHTFQWDTPGKDSARFRQSGARQILLASPNQWVHYTETQTAQVPTLKCAIERLDKSACDLILVEGFTRETFSKIEVYRRELKQPPLFAGDSNIIAVVSNGPLVTGKLPLLPLDDTQGIADYIYEHLTAFSGS